MAMTYLANFADVALKLFAFGLLARAVLSWVAAPGARKAEQYLDRLYKPFLTPFRKVFKPVQLNTVPATALDLTPLLLLCLIWWFLHPFVMWLLK